MRLQINYTLAAQGFRTGDDEEKLRYSGPGCFWEARPSDMPGVWVVVVEGAVDAGGLSLATEDLPTGPDGKTPARMMLVPEEANFAGFAKDVTNALAFLYGQPLTYLASLQKRLIPDDDHDRQVLADFGTDEPYGMIHIAFETLRTVADRPPSQALMDALVTRSAGLRLYAEATALNRPVAQYCALWRVLESAFGEQGDNLVRTLSQYPPVVKSGPGVELLRQLYVVRGRASHAATKAPQREFMEVEVLVSRHLNSLLALVVRVLLTKGTWGAPTCGVHALPIPSAHWGERVFDL